MGTIGYALSSEEHNGPELVRFAQLAEQAGFRDCMVSDHFHPWVDEQGNSPFVWSVIGGIGATTDLRVGTGVTCPILRTHPGLIAQAAATSATLCSGGFYLGVGSGENLNEHVFGDRWPNTDERLAMLQEAVQVIRLLWEGGTKDFEGDYYVLDNARIGDGYVNTSPDAELVKTYREAGGTGPVQAMVKVCWHQDAAAARKLIHRLWPNHGLTGELAQELKTPAHFEQASQLVDEQKAVGSIAHGPDPQPYVDSIRQYLDAGFTELYVHQIGKDQEGFFRFWTERVAPELGV